MVGAPTAGVVGTAIALGVGGATGGGSPCPPITTPMPIRIAATIGPRTASATFCCGDRTSELGSAGGGPMYRASVTCCGRGLTVVGIGCVAFIGGIGGID